MDNNEQIVRTWLETQGFLVQNRIKYKAHSGENAGWSDIDLIAYNPSKNKKVAVDVTAWMTEKIRFSYVINPTGGTYKRLHKINSAQARSTIRKLFNAQDDNQYEIWHVVSFISDAQREQVIQECLKYVSRIIEFPEIMKDLISFVKENPNVTQETETLHTIRALVLCDLIK